jgi:Tfp pilus assembly PilM family ATPase
MKFKMDISALYSSYTALDITNTDIRVVSMKKNRVRQWGSERLPEGLVKDGIILEPQSLGVIIDKLFKDLNLDRSRVVCTVTGLPFIYRTIRMPVVWGGIQDETIQREARREMSLTGDDMQIFWQPTEEYPDKERDYFVLGVPRNSIEPLQSALNGAGISSFAADIKPLALARAAGFHDALIVSLEHNCIDIIAVANGLVRVMHSLSPALEVEDYTGVLNEIVDGLNMTVKSLEMDFPDISMPAEAPVLLAGQVASSDGLLKLLQEATGRDTNLLEPPLETPPDLPPGLYNAALGLISKNLPGKTNQVYNDIDINLMQGTRKPVKRSTYLAYSGVAVAILLLAALAYKTWDWKADATARVESLKKESVVTAQQLAAAQKAHTEADAANKAAAGKLPEMENTLAAVQAEYQQILSYQTDYASYIVEITSALPKGAEYSSMDLSPGQIDVQGFVEQPSDVLLFNRALEAGDLFNGAVVSSLSPIENSEGAYFRVIVTK